MKKQTAGRDVLGALAPTFAHLNDDVLFGEVWSRQGELPARQRSLVTCASLMSQGLFPQLETHLRMARDNGVTREEIVETFTHLAFYAGWPKAWSAFSLVADIWGDEAAPPPGPTAPIEHGPFPLGDPVERANFTGNAWLSMMTGPGATCSVGNITFAPGCVNRWHTHPRGQLLLVTAGRGWEREEGKPARRLGPGDVVDCPPGVRHWHGAAVDSSLTHVAITPMAPGEPAVQWAEFPDLEEHRGL
jgi:4-carboxymuconolactone decarboxylase